MIANRTDKQNAAATATTAEKQSEQSSGSAHCAAYEKYCNTLGIDAEKGTTSFETRIRRDYQWHTFHYWLAACAANGMLWAQIVIGAALTALGASHAPGSKTATIFLGAANTVIAGFLTYFKSRGQPNRARQFRQALRKVRDKMDETANQFDETISPEEAHSRALEILKLYDEAIAEAAANYPDLWVTVNDMRKYLHGTGDPNSGGGAPDDLDGVVKPDIVAPTEPQPPPTAPTPTPAAESSHADQPGPSTAQDGSGHAHSPPAASQATSPLPEEEAQPPDPMPPKPDSPSASMTVAAMTPGN